MFTTQVKMPEKTSGIYYKFYEYDKQLIKIFPKPHLNTCSVIYKIYTIFS